MHTAVELRRAKVLGPVSDAKEKNAGVTGAWSAKNLQAVNPGRDAEARRPYTPAKRLLVHSVSSVEALRSLNLTSRTFVALIGVVISFVFAHFFGIWLPVARIALGFLGVALLADILLLYRGGGGVHAAREMTDRLSNGDDNPIDVTVRNEYAFTIRAAVIDEAPVPFQLRDNERVVSIPAGETRNLIYLVHPTQRGAYVFGDLHVYAQSPIGLVERHYRFGAAREVPVYPSFLQMRKYALLAANNRLEESGVKKIRRVGHTMEFDHIREYVAGDDIRALNWKATARRAAPMVNQYRDERGQPVYCLIDIGRRMEMPFAGMTLLDYGINASLVLANIALRKEDRVGLITFSKEVSALLPARRSGGQLQRFQETLYNVQTDFLESDFSVPAAYLRQRILHRSLLLIFTNFETKSSMQRQLPYLRMMARQHAVVVVIFENTELIRITGSPAADTEGIYIRTIAEKFAHEKREIVRTLRRYGIISILTAPEHLTVETLNQYLGMKARGEI